MLSKVASAPTMSSNGIRYSGEESETKGGAEAYLVREKLTDRRLVGSVGRAPDCGGEG